jgi:endonuclease/exonuclease/phosphatase family metal-dependent hydrolase
MRLKLALYNVEWMKELFYSDGSPKRADQGSKEERRAGARSARLAAVVQAMDPDVLCVVEGPDTLVSGARTASGQLEAWRDLHRLDPDYRGVHGFPSGGQQELCALYRQSKTELLFTPENKASRHPFNKPFLVDTTDRLIKEQYKHYRPPLELTFRAPGGDNDLARLILAHTKSKGIFDMVDFARFEQLSWRNRNKLYGECFSIRERCDQWFDQDPAAKIIVAGDINDGFGLDYYEQRFSRSAIEILLGSVWQPDRILRPVIRRPRLGKYGWTPSSSRYKDRITEDYFNVLIDHVLVSRAVGVEDPLIWNPYLDDAPDEVKAIKGLLKEASDHYPVSVEIEI